MRPVPRFLQTTATITTIARRFASSSTASMPKYVKRITSFKIPKESDIDDVLAAYVVLRKNATRNGKPYILSNESRRVANTSSPLSDGYTVISQTVFANWEDANYYDKECPAHMELKKTTGPKREGVQTLIYESEVGVEGAGTKL